MDIIYFLNLQILFLKAYHFPLKRTLASMPLIIWVKRRKNIFSQFIPWQSWNYNKLIQWGTSEKNLRKQKQPKFSDIKSWLMSVVPWLAGDPSWKTKWWQFIHSPKIKISVCLASLTDMEVLFLSFRSWMCIVRSKILPRNFSEKLTIQEQKIWRGSDRNLFEGGLNDEEQSRNEVTNKDSVNTCVKEQCIKLPWRHNFRDNCSCLSSNKRFCLLCQCGWQPRNWNYAFEYSETEIQSVEQRSQTSSRWLEREDHKSWGNYQWRR